MPYKTNIPLTVMQTAYTNHEDQVALPNAVQRPCVLPVLGEGAVHE